MTGTQVLLVLLFGTLAALDLVAWPQVQINRPLVAALLGGLAVGQPLIGAMMGALLELFALETLPVGAVRYPDWGPGAVAAGALAGAGPQATAPAGLLGVVVVATLTAWVGGWVMHVVRRANALALRDRVGALNEGDARALAALQRGGLAREAVRGLSLTALAIVAGDRLTTWLVNGWTAPAGLARVSVAAASTGVALWAGWRLFGHDRAALMLAAGLAAGAIVALAWAA